MPKGGRTKTAYTPQELLVLQQYAEAHREELLPGRKHTLSPILQEKLGMNSPNPRHTAHSVHAKLRSLVAPVGTAAQSIGPITLPSNPWMQQMALAQPQPFSVPAAAAVTAAGAPTSIDPRMFSACPF